MRRTVFAALTIGGVLGFAAVPAAAQQPALTSPSVSTEGRASLKVAPEIAWITLTSESRAVRTADAQKQNAAAIDAVKASLRQAGAPDGAVKTRSYSVEPQLQYTDGKSRVIGYIARQSLEVRVDDLAKIGAFIDAAGGSGATSISNIRYDVKDRAGVETKLLGEAVREGMKRAEAIAAGAGKQIVTIWRIDEERFPGDQSQPMMQMGAFEGVATKVTQIAPDELEIRVQVSLTVILR